MLQIRDKNGIVISQSQNLAGIRRAVSKQLVKCVDVSRIESGIGAIGKLCILFDNGDSFETNFASYAVLKEVVRNWRNLYGAPLRMNGIAANVVKHSNMSLEPTPFD